MKRCPNCGTDYPDEANFCPLDAGRLVVATTPGPAVVPAARSSAPGLLGGRFQLGPRIAGRRTGEIFEAIDTTSGLPCVVKLVFGEVFPTPLLRQRTERELKQLERVRAATVAHVLGHGKEGEQL